MHKFGGAALADAAAIANVGALLAAEAVGQRRVIVTSALKGVTNALVESIAHATAEEDAAARHIATELRALHLETARGVFAASGGDPSLDELVAHIDTAFDDLERQLLALAEGDARALALSDVVLALGERLAARIVSAMLDARGIASTVIDGAELVQTDGRHGNAAPDLERTEAVARAALAPMLARDITVVVPGFIGAGPNGVVVTLGRGGSDLSATVLARAIDAREVTLWKDVPGCMTADPRIVPAARVVPVLDAREASELAYYGAKVLHPRTLIPLRNGMTLRLRPFADPAAAGTTIVVGRVARGAPVRAISGMSRQALVAVSGTGMLGVPGVAARVFGALAAAHVSVSMISQASSEQSICFTIPSDRAEEVGTSLRAAFADELARREVDEISVRPSLTTVAVVGSGMARTPGVSARIFGAVAHAGVNVVAIAQGASERNVSFVVEEAEAPAAVRAVHDAFRLDKVGGGRAGRRSEPTDVILLGMGRVARELVLQVQAVAKRGGSLRIVGLIDRHGYVFHPRGLPARQLASLVLAKERGGSLARMPGGHAATARESVDFIASHALSRPVLVDVASGDTAAALLSGIVHGMDVVMANKVPLASDLATARELLREARARGRRVLHEATVGAGLPIIDTLQQLRASGDRVDSVDSSPSGTMGYLFSEMGRGRTFSDAVRQAMALGYTEPDPRDDLCGLDVARKGLILGRMLGYSGEMADVSLESLVPESLRDVPAERFTELLDECDAEWARRVDEARTRGEVLRYRARSTRGGVRVGLVSVPIG
ncbi:MAG: aspartate kinase, partial [Gemmatimonadota bacterium]|nr:aspartate kinase [Gemmatimonadota bacterium]